MEPERIEEELKKIVSSLDKGARVEAVIVEEDEYRVILSKGAHSDRASLSKGLLEDFLGSGERRQEIKKTLGKVVSKLTLMAQKRR